MSFDPQHLNPFSTVLIPDAIRFESTAEHAMDVTPEGLYDRFVNKKHGSYCFGQNSLMLEILRGLGFR